MNQTNISSYMPHVDGLRSVAVLSVLMYHFGIPGFSGGYVGVDVFFVISGFLISRIITREIETTGEFNFKNFYIRRIRRILPALLFVFVATTVATIFLFTPEDFVRFGGSLAASAVSLSNILFWSESGYFDTTSHLKPLLHTWSLSVEEQFYLFWPWFIFLVWHTKNVHTKIISIVTIGVISFCLNHFYVVRGGVGFSHTIFFLVQFRVFEFSIGALGILIIDRLPKTGALHEVMTMVGLGFVISSVTSLRHDSVFPYVNALAPCIGALLVILATESRWSAFILRNRIAVGIGLISYSLYLVHWPIVVFIEYTFFTASRTSQVLAMIFGSFLAAYILYSQIERRFRYTSGDSGRNNIVFGTLACSLLAFSTGLSVNFSEGWLWRYRFFTPGAIIMPYKEEIVANRNPFTAETSALQFDAEKTNENREQNHRVTQISPNDSSKAKLSLTFMPLTATEINAGKSRRFDDLHTSCNLMELNNSDRCHLDRPVQILVFGNSHEPDAFNMFNYMYGENKKVNIISFGTVNNCDFKFNEEGVFSSTDSLDCDKRFQVINSENFIQKVNFIVYNTNHGFDYASKDLWRVLELLSDRNKSIKIIAIGSYLQTTIDCPTLFNRTGTFDSCRALSFNSYFNPNEKYNSPIQQVKTLEYLYISKYDLLCKTDKLNSCLTFANDEPMFYDSHHLSRGFSRYLGKLIAENYTKQLVALGLPIPKHN
jgi:peptidoglycan/LPS O-acetylase OafA/YrhL